LDEWTCEQAKLLDLGQYQSTRDPTTPIHAIQQIQPDLCEKVID